MANLLDICYFLIAPGGILQIKTGGKSLKIGIIHFFLDLSRLSIPEFRAVDPHLKVEEPYFSDKGTWPSSAIVVEITILWPRNAHGGNKSGVKKA